MVLVRYYFGKVGVEVRVLKGLWFFFIKNVFYMEKNFFSVWLGVFILILSIGCSGVLFLMGLNSEILKYIKYILLLYNRVSFWYDSLIDILICKFFLKCFKI